MSIEYDNYLAEHRVNVGKGLYWFRNNLPEYLAGNERALSVLACNHDYTKDGPKEYYAYDQYFYGGQKTKEVEEEFNKAWLHHIHSNPHHWQHWVLINDEAEEGIVTLRMPYYYVIEMICDWWAFSWNKGNLYEIFDWYDKHKDYMKLHADTRELVEEILSKMKEKLDEGSASDNG